MAYTTADAMRAYAGISGSGDDGLLATFADAAQAHIDKYTRRTFEGSDTARYFTIGRETEGRWLWFDEDLASITEILNGDASATEVTSGQYVVEPKDAPYYGVKILASASKVWEYVTDPENAIKVTGVWAYSTTAPDDIVQAATRLAVFMYRQKDTSLDLDRPLITDAGVTLLPAGLPNDVKSLLLPYRRPL